MKLMLFFTAPHSLRQLPASSERGHEDYDAPKVLWLDHLHRVITTTLDFWRDNHTVEVIGLPIELKGRTYVKSKIRC